MAEKDLLKLERLVKEKQTEVALGSLRTQRSHQDRDEDAGKVQAFDIVLVMIKELIREEDDDEAEEGF